jgi:two-component system phosphate regulon sensor histidine kinase PhoR
MALSLKKRIAAVSEEKSRLATILSTMADGVMMTDESGTIVLTNRAAENLFGFNADRAIGLPVIQVIRDHEIDSALKACLTTGKAQTVQVDSGTAKRFLRAIAIPLSAENRLNGALLLFQDLTELRDLQTMRRELVSNVTHELMTPLAGIKAIVETLADGAIDDKLAAKDFLVRIDSEVDRLTQMVNELTDLSRIESGKTDLKLGPGHLKALVEGVVARLKPQAERQNLTISIELPPDLPIVPLDKGRIEQVVTNILHNAIKFTPPGGKITISAKAEPDVVVVSIADTGMGISKEDLPHVFERFWKADRARSGGGTGLGLSIAKHIIQAQGGRIWAESTEGQGSTFHFSLRRVA